MASPWHRSAFTTSLRSSRLPLAIDGVLHFAGKIAAGSPSSIRSGTGTPTSPRRWPCLTRCAGRHAAPGVQFLSRRLRQPGRRADPGRRRCGADQPLRLDQAGRRHGDQARVRRAWPGRGEPAHFNVAGAARAADGRILGERHHPETHLIRIGARGSGRAARAAGHFRHRLSNRRRHAHT